MTWIIDCFTRRDCAAAVSTAAMGVLALVGIIQAIVLTATWVAIRSSTRETSLLRRETAKQVRLSALPILTLTFHRGPDRVFCRNVSAASAASAASRALLQGFRFRWNDATWRCTFEPTGIIAPGQEIALGVLIEQEPLSPTHERSVPDNQIFTTAFRRAFVGTWPDMVLALYFEDMLGNNYRSRVRVELAEFSSFIEGTAQRSKMRPEISGTTLIADFPQSVELTDWTTPRQFDAPPPPGEV